MRPWTVLALMLVLILTAGCASRGERVDSNIEAVQTHDFNPRDLQVIGMKATKDLLDQVSFDTDGRPAVYVADIRNLTNEHINAEAIRAYVAVEIAQSNKVRLLERKAAWEESLRELEFQQSPLVDPTTRARAGRQVGADYFVQGTLNNIVSEAGRRKGQYFLFTLGLVNIETGDVKWSKVEIQKLSKRGIFGW